MTQRNVSKADATEAMNIDERAETLNMIINNEAMIISMMSNFTPD
jgi:hypothetical protein